MSPLETATGCYWRAARLTLQAVSVEAFDLALRTLDTIALNAPTINLALAGRRALVVALGRLPDQSPEVLDQLAAP